MRKFLSLLQPYLAFFRGRGKWLGIYLFLVGTQIQATPETLCLSLEEAIKIALEQHPDLLSSELRIESEKEGVAQAEANYWPRLSGDVVSAYTAREVTRSDADSAYGITDALIARRVSCGLILRQMIADFGRTGNLISATKSAVEAKIATFFSTRDRVVFNVIRAYYSHMRAEEILKTAQKTHKSRHHLHKALAHNKAEWRRALLTRLSTNPAYLS